MYISSAHILFCWMRNVINMSISTKFYIICSPIPLLCSYSTFHIIHIYETIILIWMSHFRYTSFLLTWYMLHTKIILCQLNTHSIVLVESEKLRILKKCMVKMPGVHRDLILSLSSRTNEQRFNIKVSRELFVKWFAMLYCYILFVFICIQYNWSCK